MKHLKLNKLIDLKQYNMSELKVNKISPRSGTDVTLGDSGDTFTVPSGATLDTTNATVTYPAGSITDAAISSTAAIQQSKILGSPGFRNIIINGDMSLAQRSTSVASITSNGYYTLDRWNILLSSLGTWTQSQSTDVPSGYGFANSLKMDCTTADATPSAGDFLMFRQVFEGQNLQYLKKGTANALPLTASFWVKSTKTGTFILELQDIDNSRTISKSYTVSTTNTWEFKTVTFEGDTTGAFDNNNESSLGLNFWLGAGTTWTSGTLATSWAATTSANRAVGQVNIADDTSNDWYITGVQLEAGTTASDFEFLPVDVNLGRCERYYQLIDIANGNTQNTTKITFNVPYRTETRATPSVSQTAVFKITNYYTTDYTQSSVNYNIVASRATNRAAETEADNFSGLTGSGTPYGLIPNEGGKIILSAEL
jgi:hypothetical protein